MLGSRLARRFLDELAGRQAASRQRTARLRQKNGRKGKPWARGTMRGVLRNHAVTERIHPRRKHGDARKPWRRKRARRVAA